jgi:uncharacterized damage-inducible protein DinB
MAAVENVSRVEPPNVADEKTMLAAFLDRHRATLLWKCEGLSEDDLRRRSVHPSGLSLLGLVRHLTDVERGWFQRGVGGQHAPPLYYSDHNPEGDVEDLDSTDVQQVFTAYTAECERSRASVAARSLDDTIDSDGEPLSVRWVVVHMLEEYARHNGHADFLRERIDGATGE